MWFKMNNKVRSLKRGCDCRKYKNSKDYDKYEYCKMNTDMNKYYIDNCNGIMKDFLMTTIKDLEKYGFKYENK